MKLITIGVYGFSEACFVQALRRSHVDTFCDVRARRGVRGSEYAFANSARLQSLLAKLGIRYVHLPELAPSAALRKRQFAEDAAAGIATRKRAVLGDAFVAGYLRERLSSFNSREFIERLGTGAKCVALFCVEGQPRACHRSLLAQRLKEDLGPRFEVIHLTPGP